MLPRAFYASRASHASRAATLWLLALCSLAALGTLAALPAFAAAPSRVVYTVAVKNIPNKLFHVTVRAEGVNAPTVRFALPAWTPGWYFLTDAYQNIRSVAARNENNVPLTATAEDKYTWRVDTNGASQVTLSYDVRAAENGYGFFQAYLDANNGFVSGPGTLMYVVAGKTAPCTIRYQVPDGWKVASANAPADRPNTFAAPDYDTLADQPADLGRFDRLEKTIADVPFSAVVIGAGDEDPKPFVENVWKLAAAGTKILSGDARPPFPRYVFHFRLSSIGGGSGLEHLNGTVIQLNRRALSSPAWALALVAHEFVHAWNVKRIRPAALGPFDYTREVRVKDLWWSEGVTEYLAPRILVEAGLQNRDFWYGYMAQNIAELENNPARLRVPLEEASLKAWEGRSKGFGGLSYYNKGMLVGLLLDIEMRARTNNRVGLDDLMRDLMKETERTGKGFAPGAIEATASRLTGTDFSSFFDRALRSTEELPFRETLAKAGLNIEEHVNRLASLGVEWQRGGGRQGASRGGLRIAAVTPGSAAEKAGLQPGDVVTAMDGNAVRGLRGALLNDAKPGDRRTLTVVRGNAAPKAIEVMLGTREERTVAIAEKKDATAGQRAIQAAITGGGAALTSSAAPSPPSLRATPSPNHPQERVPGRGVPVAGATSASPTTLPDSVSPLPALGEGPGVRAAIQ